MERIMQMFLGWEVTHHSPVSCRKIHKHLIAENVQSSESKTKKTHTHTQMKKTYFSSLLLHMYLSCCMDYIFNDDNNLYNTE